MNFKKNNLLFLVLLIFVFNSCVSAKMHKNLQDENKNLKEQMDQDAASCKEEIERLNKEKMVVEAQLITVENDLESTKKEVGLLDELYKELQNQLKNVVAGSNLEKNKLLGSLDEYKKTLLDKEKKLSALSTELEIRQNELKNLQRELAFREQKLKELQDALDQKDAFIEKIRKNLENLLFEFKDKGISIEMVGGRIYVRLAASLLFQLGKTEVDEAGKNAIISLAKAIEKEQEIQILVEGHTDSSPIKSVAVPKDNWELSVLRATSVVNLMITNSKIKPETITAAGRAEFLPVSSNNKNLNRRIEVIIIPNLEKIFEAVK